MKKTFSMLALLIISVLMLGTKGLAAESDPFAREDYERIIDAIRQNSSSLSFLGLTDVDDAINSIHLDEIKRLYYANVDIPKTWAENKTVYSFMGDFVQIKVPVVQGEYIYVISLSEKNGNVYFLGASQGPNVKENVVDNAFGFNQDDIMEILQKEGIEYNEVEDVQYLCAAQYGSLLFAFIKTPDKEYLIPYSDFDDDLGIESGKLYSADDLISILSKYVTYVENEMGGGGMKKEASIVPDSDEGGQTDMVTNANLALTVSVILGLLLFGVLILIVVHAKRKRQ